MAKLTCPNCGVATSFSPAPIIGKGILLDYSDKDQTKFTKVQISAITTYNYEEDTFAILVCQACKEYFLARREKYCHPDSDKWSAVYPILHKPVAKEIPEPIKSEFEEANLCFAIGAYIACLLVCRTVLISLQREQGVSNLKELMERGIISTMLYGQADQVRLWANTISHEDIVPDSVTKENSEQLLTYMESVLNAVYVEPKRLSSLTQKRQQLKKK